MLSQTRILFLQEKIMDLQQALFFNLSDAVLKLPTSVINALNVDEVGQIWFFVKRPPQNISEFYKEFRSRLDFYKKGRNYYLHLTGKACMVTDPEEINNVTGLTELHKKQAIEDMVLLKFRVTDIHHYHYQEKRPPVIQQGVKINLHPSAFFKTLQYIVKDIIPVFQSH
jgi:general stress protein 26